MAARANQVVIITGCSTGIGRALAREFHRTGHHVFATARREESVAALREEGLSALPLDVTEPASIGGAVSAVVEQAGRIDLLVNNAGFNVFGPLAEVPLAQLRAILDTNVTGVMATTQAVFPQMARQRSGRIVNVGSVVGILPTPFAGAYCASKAALHMLSDVLRMEVKPFGIDVVVVQPGGVRSSIAETGAEGIERYASEASHYRAAHAGIRKRAYASQDNPMEAEDFARELVEQVTAEEAPRVVRLGAGADVLPKLAELPGEQLDAMMIAQYQLGDIGRS